MSIKSLVPNIEAKSISETQLRYQSSVFKAKSIALGEYNYNYFDFEVKNKYQKLDPKTPNPQTPEFIILI